MEAENIPLALHAGDESEIAVAIPPDSRDYGSLDYRSEFVASFRQLIQIARQDDVPLTGEPDTVILQRTPLYILKVQDPDFCSDTKAPIWDAKVSLLKCLPTNFQGCHTTFLLPVLFSQCLKEKIDKKIAFTTFYKGGRPPPLTALSAA